MYRKSGVIHLGQSRSPVHGKNNSRSKHKRIQQVKTQRRNQPLQDSIHLNNSMHVAANSAQIHKVKSNNLYNTHAGFFPPSPRQVEQVLVKQNIRPIQKTIVVEHSPLKRVIVSRPITVIGQNSPSKISHSINNQSQISQHQSQLQRKIKMLESRIQQLHQQKQVFLVKSHEENKKLGVENISLKNKLSQIQNIKNNQIFALRQQITNLKTQANSQRKSQAEPSLKPNIPPNMDRSTKLNENKQNSQISSKSLKNLAYTEEQDKIQINNITYKEQAHQPSNTAQQDRYNNIDKKYKLLEKQHEDLLLRFKQLELENSRLSSEISELKESLLQNSSIIEENNKQIVANYQNKINSLNEQLSSCHKGDQQRLLELENKVQFLKNLNQDYVQRLLSKSQEVMILQDNYKFKKIQADQQIQEYIHKLSQRDQQMVNLEESYRQKIHQLQAKIQISCQTINKSQEKVKFLEQKLAQAQTARQTELETVTMVQSKQCSQQVVTQSCQKCKQLIKTLVKLNQKAFSKTS